MMDRPFIEFMQVQRLPWNGEGAVGPGVRDGARIRVLSVDPADGACSLLVQYPPGWRRERSETLTADEELFVVSGDLTIDEQTYGRYGYGHLPAGHCRHGMSSVEGAVVLTFFSAHPESRPASAHASGWQEERLVAHVDSLAGEWGGGFHPRFPPGAGRKWLRRDPVTGDDTWILGTMPLRSGRRAEKHPVVEEMYLLSGELHGHLGVMRPGAYFWRPPEEWHGPFGSLTGNVLLFRTVGGPLSTEYREEETEFSWFPPDDPILPSELETLPQWSGCSCTAY